ncbi:MAG: helix-turn-helix domain-containing protein [Bryobacteraceae bacterium]
MIRLTYVPGPPLSQFIHMLWLYEGYRQPHARERVLPTGEMQIVINLLEDRSCIYDRDDTDRCQTFSGSLLSGAHSEYLVINTAMQASVIGVSFKPGGAFPFLRMPAGELRDTTVSLDTLWGAAAANLRDRLLEAATHRDRFQILERALLSELARGFDQQQAVRFALRQFMEDPHAATVAGVTDRVGLSPKRFIQAFRDQTGFTPKVFCRIRRFQQVLDRIAGVKTVEWASVALDCGYFDQAHFIHDFRAFSGINPSTYLAYQTPHRNHVPLPD